MTVHSAKGLEFDVVFISGLEEGLFPHENSVREDKGLEEERRLMYVAVTRARKRLYISHAQTRMLHGQTRYNLPSRFFDEIPAELLKWLTPKLARGPAAVPGRPTFAAPRRPAWAEPAPAAVVRRSAAQETGGFRIGQNVEPRQVRPGHHRQRRGRRLGRPRPGEFRPRGRQVAGAVGGQADGCLRRTQ
jgi:DNA helicase-2/ATP-dependent DNA helicase PcrA